MTNDEAVLDSTPALASMFRLQWEEVQQSWVLLYPEGMVKLNGSAGEIIKRLDGKKFRSHGFAKRRAGLS
jgi:pyrroloquinoline quinone biosynthesis protein D